MGCSPPCPPRFYIAGDRRKFPRTLKSGFGKYLKCLCVEIHGQYFGGKDDKDLTLDKHGAPGVIFDDREDIVGRFLTATGGFKTSENP